jgi:cytochrome c-type biogenesis protein CcmH/NrfG
MDSTEDRVNQAVLQFTLGEEEVAETQLRAILQEHAGCVEAWRALAEVCLSRGCLDDAEQACRQALQLSPEDLTITVSLARILVNKGDKDGAEEATSKARILGWKEELAQDD